MTDLAAQTLTRLKTRRWTLATAESCTGGMVSAALTDIPGSSEVVDRGFVTYSNAAKTDMLAVPATLIHDHGAVSEEVAAAMSLGALEVCKVDISVAITGVAGPGGTERKPEGMVWFSICRRDHAPTTLLREFGAIGRAQIRQAATETALRLLLLAARG